VLVSVHQPAGDPDYGWADPGEPLAGLEPFGVRAVRRVVAGPSAAESPPGLLRTVAVVVGARALIALGRRHAPEVMACLEPRSTSLRAEIAIDPLGRADEDGIDAAVWEAMPHASLCGDVLALADELGVVSMPDTSIGERARPAFHAVAA
jgi:hypothetical protein